MRSWIQDARPTKEIHDRDLPVVFHAWRQHEDGSIAWDQDLATGRVSAVCSVCGAKVMRWDVEQSGLGITSSCLTNLDIVWRLTHRRVRTRCG